MLPLLLALTFYTQEITTIRGAKPGPTLAVIAGLSGTDYAPIIAVQQLIQSLSPADFSGTLLIVPVANIPAFMERSVYLNSADHKDLTKSFPGKPDGTPTELIAHTLTTQVVDKADAVIVLQAGGVNTMLQPHVVQAITGNAQLDSKISIMALAFGINFIITDKTLKAGNSLEAAALARSKPVLKVLCGSFGISDSRTTDIVTKGILSMMSIFEMRTAAAIKTRSPAFFDHVTVVASPQSGTLFAYVQRGQNVRKGEPIFGIAGFTGKNPAISNSPVDGIVLSIVASPPINKGEPIISIGVPREP